jgi:hypothetical protein
MLRPFLVFVQGQVLSFTVILGNDSSIFFSFSGNQSSASVLLTSFKSGQSSDLFSASFKGKLIEKYQKILEKDFKEHFGSQPYEILVHHRATQYDLWQALHGAAKRRSLLVISFQL